MGSELGRGRKMARDKRWKRGEGTRDFGRNGGGGYAAK